MKRSLEGNDLFLYYLEIVIYLDSIQEQIVAQTLRYWYRNVLIFQVTAYI